MQCLTPDVLCQSLLHFENFRPHDILAVGQDGPHPLVNFRLVAPVLFFAVDEFHFERDRLYVINRLDKEEAIGRKWSQRPCPKSQPSP
jgi:hypothetical protein